MLRLAGGPGVGDGLVVIGTLDGQVIALDQNDGTEKWRANVPNEVIAAPAVAQNMVFVRSNDGRVTAFEGATGQRRWFTERESPSLTVRGNAPVIPGTDLLFVGNDDGTISALAMHDGNSLWVQSVAMPEGRSELERMADVDGVPVLEGNTLYATSYKNETVAIDGASGRMLWNREHGGAGGVGVSSNYIVVADNDGTVWGLDKPTGSASWSQPALARRFLTGVAIQEITRWWVITKAICTGCVSVMVHLLLANALGVPLSLGNLSSLTMCFWCRVVMESSLLFV